MKYLDISVEDVERIKKGRNNINKGIIVNLILFVFMGVIAIVALLVDKTAVCIVLFLFSLMYLILVGVLIIKREIYSVAIILKEAK